jgi:hypothetical protein
MHTHEKKTRGDGRSLLVDTHEYVSACGRQRDWLARVILFDVFVQRELVARLSLAGGEEGRDVSVS